MTHFEAVFRSAHGKGLAGGVIQWGALANVAQYRLPYEKTLAHLSTGDQRASLVELARVLKPGGTLLVFHLPNTFSWIECLVRQVNPWLRKPVFQHSRLFTRADVERLLPPDLSIVKCGRSNIIPRNPGQRAAGVAPRFTGLRRRAQPPRRPAHGAPAGVRPKLVLRAAEAVTGKPGTGAGFRGMSFCPGVGPAPRDLNPSHWPRAYRLSTLGTSWPRSPLTRPPPTLRTISCFASSVGDRCSGRSKPA